ncbi:MAG TPA: hypothetical protein VFL46_00750 [Phycicoccus sp.]|nr:hypothetical protein [Phycicoccus sp.]
MTPPRRPRFLRIILTGAVIGFLAGAAVAVGGWFEDTTSVRAQGPYTPTAAIGYLGLLGAGLLALLAALLAVVIDRRADRA